MLVVDLLIVGCRRIEPVHVAVVHAKGRGSEDRVVDGFVIGTVIICSCD